MLGNRYGKLVVISESERKKHYVCRCDCGNESVVLKYNLLKGNSASCGCSRKRLGGLSRANKAEHNIWKKMLNRCLKTSDRSYKNYGGRGITVCIRWQESFANFLADMGKRPSEKHSLDRIDNNSGYEPCNCRWATKKIQTNNCRRNKHITYKNEKLTIAQASDKYGINRATLLWRIKNGWTPQQAIEESRKLEMYPFNGSMLNLMDISRITGIKYATLYYRIQIRNQPPDKAFNP